jgi:hypothetical protein
MAAALLHAASLAAQGNGGGAYLYDAEGYAMPCPEPYAPSGMLLFPLLPTGSLDFPQYLALGPGGSLLVSDEGNARIVEIAPDGGLLREYRDPGLSKPGGLCYDARDGSVYVTDAASASILRFDSTGRLRRIFAPPRSEVLPEHYLYSPTRVLVDARGWLSVIGTGSSGGIIQLDGEGTFRGFFGANPAPTSLVRKLARAVASREQKNAQLLQVLQPYSDFTLDDDGFITTVTETTATGQIRRLNPLGVSVFPQGKYGEPVPEVDAKGRKKLGNAHLAYVATDTQGIVTVADRVTLKIFEYSPEGELLFIWGGKGGQRGSFQSISGIAVDGESGTLYVLDGVANAVQIFTPTEFARLVHLGLRRYADGRYSESLSVWAEVRRKDANYPVANKGIAKVLLRLGTSLGRMDYLKAAMERSREAGDREEFSAAFAAHRRLWVQRAMPFFVLAAAALFAVVIVSSRRRSPRAPRGMRVPSPFLLWRAIGHPFRVMEEVKWSYRRETIGAAALVLFLAFAARVFMLSAASFHFTTWDPGRVSLASEAARLLLPWFTWVGANSLVIAIFGGEGKIGQIFSASAFAMVPYVLLTVLLTLLSHALSLQERGLYSALQLLMYAWMLALFLLGAATVHGYSLRAAIGTSLLSLAGIVILWGVAVLVLGLVSTFAGFLVDIVKEVSLRA